MSMIDLRLGNCVEVMRSLPEASVDAIVCDPPYGLEFMGKEWDSCDSGDLRQRGDETFAEADAKEPFGRVRHGGAKSYGGDLDAIHRRQQEWHLAWSREALRVLKPGGHLVAFGGSRTYHRMACAIEDAGFEIRDSLHWFYGSGFPKSLDVSKALDKAAGVEREAVGYDATRARPNRQYETGAIGNVGATGKAAICDRSDNGATLTAPATEEAKRWSGWGTALKPAHEPIILARKPLIGTVAANVLEHGTGGLNIDACRLGSQGQPFGNGSGRHGGQFAGGGEETHKQGPWLPSAGRWPPNVLLTHSASCEQVGTIPGEIVSRTRHGGGAHSDKIQQLDPDKRNELPPIDTSREVWSCAPDCPVAALDAQSGDKCGAAAPVKGTEQSETGQNGIYGRYARVASQPLHDGAGGASRFFPTFTWDTEIDVGFLYCAKPPKRERNAGLDGKNGHPTVKPVRLMEWLVRLVTPPGGVVLDPFLGSGTTGCAAARLGFDFIGIEREQEYLSIAEKRIAHATAPKLASPKAPPAPPAPANTGQLDLLAKAG